MASTYGFTIGNLFTGNSPMPIGSADIGPMDVLIKAGAAGIYIGNSAVTANLPTTGYELTPGQEYRFTVYDDVMYFATTSSTNVTVSGFVTPHIA